MANYHMGLNTAEYGRSILAHLPRPHQGQLVELRFAAVRSGHFDNTLGFGGDGPIYTSHRRAWRPRGIMDGVALCRMFQRAIHGQSTSAPIMIRCIDSIDGKPIFESLK